MFLNFWPFVALVSYRIVSYKKKMSVVLNDLLLTTNVEEGEFKSTFTIRPINNYFNDLNSATCLL